MGYIAHHAIVVTGYGEDISEARDEAARLGLNVSSIVGPVVNGYSSFLVAPDGSKEGWEHSDSGNAKRHAFIMWLRPRHYHWAEVRYSPDDDDAKVTRHAWDTGTEE